MATHGVAATVRGTVDVKVEKSKGVWETAKAGGRAVAYLTGLEEPGPSRKGKITLDQKDAEFVPRVLPITVGDTVFFRNDDDMYHNVWSVSKAAPFDLGSFKAPQEKPVTFKKPGLVKVFCNVHPNMIAYILVLKNRKFAVADDQGKFSIPNVPRGKYRLHLWAEGAEIQSREIRVAGDVVEKFEAKSSPDPAHMNKFGKPYN